MKTPSSWQWNRLLAMALTLMAVQPTAVPALDVSSIARDIAQDVGTVGRTFEGTKGPVFVFEENHGSRVGQLQIAVMLVRLHDRHNLRYVGVEGATESTAPNGSWFHGLGGEAARETREDVAVRLLAEGEISQAEFIELTFADVRTTGLEVPSEYAVEFKVEGNPEGSYLLAIAEKVVKQADIPRINELIKQGKNKEAVDQLLGSDPWVKAHWEATQDKSNPSVERTLTSLRETVAKAREVNAEIDPKVAQEMQSLIRFYEAASKRSLTMVDRLASASDVEAGKPVAIVIGAAHTDKMLDLLQKRSIGFAALTPLVGLDAARGQLSNEQFTRKNAGQLIRTTAGTLGALLKSQRKPPPVIGSSTLKGYANLNFVAALAGEAVRQGQKVPDSIWSQVETLKDIRVDRDSFEVREDFDVIFRAWVTDSSGREREVWARVGTFDAPEERRTLEEKLKKAIAGLGGGGKEPPGKDPNEKSGVEDEGPGDRRKGKILISAVGRRAMATYVGSREEARKLTRISS